MEPAVGKVGAGSDGICDAKLSTGHSSLADSLRKTIMEDLDREVADRLSALWKKGAGSVLQVQQESDQRIEELTRKVGEFAEAQCTMEAENERLKQAITSLGAQLAMIGATFGGMGNAADLWGTGVPGVSPCTVSAETSTATPLSLQETVLHRGVSDSSAVRTASPQEGVLTTPCDSEATPLLAEVPAFPFSQPQQWSAPPTKPAPAPVPSSGAGALSLSLADALGIGEKHEEPTPTSVATPVTPPVAVPTEEEVECFVFALTLRVAAGLELGLSTSQNGEEKALRIDAVLPGSAAEAWNRQCGGSGAPERMLTPGDRITRVNDVGEDPQAMLRECGSQRLLRFQVVRRSDAALASLAPSQTVGPASPAPPSSASAASSPGKSSQLRVEAAAFVPKGLVS